MPPITDTAAETFRDFEVDGVPSSGRHDVVKADVRVLFASIDEELQEIRDLADGVIFTGAYSSGTTYATGESVSDAGASYVSLVDDNLNHTPASSPTQWQLLAAKGADGSASSSSTVAWSGVISPTQITANQNNYSPTGLDAATVLRLSSDAEGRIITGLAGGAAGRKIVMRNVSSFAITLSATAATGTTSSSTFNRFAFPDDLALTPTGADIEIQYDATATRWKLSAASLQEGKAEPETTIASASTTDIGASNTRRVAVSGTATITSFGTRAKQERVVRFTEALVLAHSSALSLKGGVSRSIVAGDSGVYSSDGSGNWREDSFTGYNTLTTLASTAATVTALDITVAALPVQPDVPSLDPDGAASVTRSAAGREVERVTGTGEVLTVGAEETPIGWLDDDGTFKMVDVAGAGVTTLLSSTLAATLKGTTFPRVQGGFRAAYTFRGATHIGRIGNGAIVPDDGRTLYVVIFTGQSNQGGAAGDLLRVTHPFPQKLLIPRTVDPADIRLYLNQLGSEEITSEDILGFTSLVGAHTYPGTTDDPGTAQSEIGLSTFARLIGEACDGWIPPICGYNCWNGGNDVASMEPGGDSNVNENVRAIGDGIVREAAKLGYKVNFLACQIDQGEADTTNATLADQWVAIVAGWSTYLKGLTGQANDIVPFITQTSSFSTSTGEKTKVARYKLDGAIIPTAPRYMIGASAWNDADYLHMDNVGHFRLGEANGYAMFKHFCQGGYVPLYAISATATIGSSSTVTVSLSEAPAIDTTLVESITQSGLTCKTTSGATVNIAINAINIVGSTLVLTLASPISQGTFAEPIITLGTYPGQNTPRDAAGICRTNVRSAAMLGRSQLDGRPIYKWLMHDTLTIAYV